VALRKAPPWGTGLREVAPGTFAYLQYDGGWGISNTGFLDGGDGLLVIDATMVASMAEAFIKEIRRVSDKPFRHLINTHSHPDHTGGNRFFAGAEIISHRICRDEMARQSEPRLAGSAPPNLMATIPRTPAMERMFSQIANDPGRQIPLPSLTYEDALTLRYGET
jgi:cyclase